MELHEHLGAAHGHTLARADQKGHALPSPGIDLKVKRGKCLRLRIGRHARFVSIAAKLAANDLARAQRRDGLEDFHLFVANGLAVPAGGGLHRKMSDDLKQMVLHDITDSADLVVKCPASLHAKLLCHRDLHAGDVPAIPDGFEDFIFETEVQKVADRGFAEVVIDPEDVAVVEVAQECLVERQGRREIATEWFFDDDARAFCAPGFPELLDDQAKERRRDRQVMRRALRWAERVSQIGEGRGVFVITVHIAQEAAQRFERGGIEAAMFLKAVACALPEVVEGPTCLGNADHGDFQVSVLGHRLERGEDFLIGQIAGGTEEDEGVGL